VIFRLPLPSLQKVEVDGDFKERGTKGTIAMSKDAKTGAWTATVKVPPGSYQYWFIADGFTMPDPSNTHVRPASGVYSSRSASVRRGRSTSVSWGILALLHAHFSHSLTLT
jgi:1,4-alpha-glucan branching enzyme